MSSAKRWMRGVERAGIGVSVAARQAAIAHPTVRGVSRPVGLDAVAERAGQQRRVDERGQEGAERARERVRAALDAAVGVEQARGVQAGAVRALGEAFERVAVHDHVWVQQHRDRLASRAPAPGCWPRRSPGCRGGR